MLWRYVVAGFQTCHVCIKTHEVLNSLRRPYEVTSPYCSMSMNFQKEVSYALIREIVANFGICPAHLGAMDHLVFIQDEQVLSILSQ